MNITGYQLTDVLNSKLSEHGMKKIPPQMIYNYIKKGYISHVVDEKGKKRVELTEAKRFITSYLSGDIQTKTSKETLMSHFEDV